MVSDCTDWEESKDSVGPRINTVADLPLLYLVFVSITENECFLTSWAR